MKSAVIFVLVVVLSTCVHGQSTSPVRTGRPDTVQREQQRQMEMQMIELALATDGRKPQTKHYTPAELKQIREDFLQIQVADRKLVKTVNAGSSELKLVTTLTGEIEKRSRRLKGILALPQPEGSQLQTAAKTEATNYEGLRSSLTILSDLIESFVSNPMFEHSKVLDQALSDKAWRDLAAIIQLSGDVKRSSERLRK